MGNWVDYGLVKLRIVGLGWVYRMSIKLGEIGRGCVMRGYIWRCREMLGEVSR